jgi:SAM-dependent methyltransferase
MGLKKMVGSTPVVGMAAKQLWRITSPLRFRLAGFQSSQYWDLRYARGGDSGAGSSGELAQFKANILNGFVANNSVGSVIEFGCGDGQQLLLSQYPRYTGYDVSPNAVKRCQDLFARDESKRFALFDSGYKGGEQAELGLSLDVIYHLVEDSIYERHMSVLFQAATRFVVIYSDNEESPREWIHVRHRRFSTWIEQYFPAWKLAEHIPNAFPNEAETGRGSFAEFWIYTNQNQKNKAVL